MTPILEAVGALNITTGLDPFGALRTEVLSLIAVNGQHYYWRRSYETEREARIGHLDVIERLLALDPDDLDDFQRGDHAALNIALRCAP